MRGTYGIEADDNASLDRTDSDASSNDEKGNEETTLFEILNSLCSKSFLLCIGRFAHLRVCSSHSEEQVLHNLSRMFADASQACVRR
jgi:hypothetical protein